MDVHPLRGALGLPFRPAVLKPPDVLLLLGIHADHRVASVHVLPGPGVDVAELRVPVGVLAPFERLGIALQAEALLLQQHRHRRRRHLVPGRGQRIRQVAGRLDRPPQRRLRVPRRLRVHQPQQRRNQPRIGLGDPLAAAARAAGPAQRLPAALQFGHAPRNGHRADIRRPRYHLDPAMPQHPRLGAHHQPPLPLIQVREHPPYHKHGSLRIKSKRYSLANIKGRDTPSKARSPRRCGTELAMPTMARRRRVRLSSDKSVAKTVGRHRIDSL